MKTQSFDSVPSLRGFMEALEPTQTQNDFLVDAVYTEKSFHLPYLKIAQGTTFALSGLAGEFVLRVEKAVNVEGVKTVEVQGAPYLVLGNTIKGTVVGIAKTKAYLEEKVRFIPIDKSTIIPAEWIGKLRTIYYVAIYTGNTLFLVEGVKTKRRITDKIVETILKKPSFYQVELKTQLQNTEKGSYIGAEITKLEPISGNSELAEVKKLTQMYIQDRLEKTRSLIQKKLGIVTQEEIDNMQNETTEEMALVGEEDEDITF